MSVEVSKQTAVGAGVCGILLLICGAGCLIPGFVLAAIGESSSNGIWSGILLIIAGVLGVITWWKRHKGVIIGLLVVTICVVIALFIQCIIAGVLYSDYKEKASWNCYRSSSDSCKCYRYGYYDTSKDLYCDQSKMNNIVRSLLAIVIFTVIGGIASFTGSIFGCMGACTCQSQPGTVVVQRPVMVTTTTLPGYSVQQPGYTVQQPGYSVQQPGYAVQQPGYSVQQPGYSVQQPGYPVQQPGYPVQQPGYPVQQPGYSAQNLGFSVQQPDNSTQQAGQQAPESDYQALQFGHQAPQSAGYQAPQSADYQAPESHYEDLQLYQAPQSADYQALQSGYQAPQSAKAAPQASSTQHQVSDNPPPEYTNNDPPPEYTNIHCKRL